MNKKTMPLVICISILIAILLIIFLPLKKQSTDSQESSEYVKNGDVSSNASSLPEKNEFYDSATAGDENVIDVIGSEDADYTDYLGAYNNEAYSNEKVLSANDPVGGVFSVGAVGASVASETNGLVLNFQHSEGSEYSKIGVQITCSDGWISCPFTDGSSTIYNLTNMHVAESDPSVKNDGVVMLWRTWDQMQSCEYNSPTDYGLAWYTTEDLALAAPAHLYIRLYDINRNSMRCIFDLTIGTNADGQYEFQNLGLYDITMEDGMDAEGVAYTKAAAVEYVKQGYFFRSEDLDSLEINDEDIFIQKVTLPYWNEIKPLNGTPVPLYEISNNPLYVPMYAVTVNCGNDAIGPVTMYLSVVFAYGEWEQYYLGCDLLAPKSWNSFVAINGLNPEISDYMTYQPTFETVN